MFSQIQRSVLLLLLFSVKHSKQFNRFQNVQTIENEVFCFVSSSSLFGFLFLFVADIKFRFPKEKKKKLSSFRHEKQYNQTSHTNIQNKKKRTQGSLTNRHLNKRKVFCARENKMVLFFVLSFTIWESRNNGKLLQKKNLCTWNKCYNRKKMKRIHTEQQQQHKTLLWKIKFEIEKSKTSKEERD